MLERPDRAVLQRPGGTLAQLPKDACDGLIREGDFHHNQLLTAAVTDIIGQGEVLDVGFVDGDFVCACACPSGYDWGDRHAVVDVSFDGGADARAELALPGEQVVDADSWLVHRFPC
jgi:hypothetical protein